MFGYSVHVVDPVSKNAKDDRIHVNDSPFGFASARGISSSYSARYVNNKDRKFYFSTWHCDTFKSLVNIKGNWTICTYVVLKGVITSKQNRFSNESLITLPNLQKSY